MMNNKGGSMEGYRGLKLIGSVTNQEKLIDCIAENLTNEWERRKDLDAAHEKQGEGGGYKTFVLTDSKYESPVGVKFRKSEMDNYYYVSSVLFLSTERPLSVQEHNSIVERFHKAFLESPASEFDVRAILETDDQSPERMMSSELLSKFQSWQGNANGTDLRSINTKYDFIIQAHEEGSLVDSERVRDYLSKAELLTEEEIKAAVNSYRQGRELLERFDKTNK